jgi:hypothetical protein
MDCMHACKWTVCDVGFPICQIVQLKYPGNSRIRDKYKIHEHIHPQAESILHEKIGEYKVQEQLLESDDS